MSTYVEPPRGYRGLVVTVVLVAAGAGLDGVIGGLSAHWGAWLLAAVVLLGVHALIIHAARVNKTLTVDATEVRVGDEVIELRRVVSASPDIEHDAPVLGWPAGMPLKQQAVTVVLDDGLRALVPTRHPEAVLAALGVAPTGDEIEIRPADPDDLLLLAEIDERAATIFRVAGYVLPSRPFPEPAEAAAIFVADRPPVGFVRVDLVDGCPHVSEISVLPGSMKRGVGSALLEAAYEWARSARHGEMTLTTYADIPWNGPFYTRRGWTESNALGTELSALRAAEVADGLDAVGPRIVMRRVL